ncbi:MAG: mCpol domain-containing protein [Syntrophomonas sp.]|nr:mCpol domain-containing protein [Syntrophomonas sp.]
MKFAYIDGDDIGLKIERSFMNNDEISLGKVNDDVKSIVEQITRYLTENDYKIIFSGADGIICKNDDIEIRDILGFIRSLNSYLEFSIGVGTCLRDSYLALRYAKANGKNMGAVFMKRFELVK